MKILKNKRNILLIIIGFLLCGVIIFGVSYAYYATFEAEDIKVPIDVTGDKLDNIVFEKGDPINLVMTQQNMAEGNGNGISASTNASVSLISNDTTNTSTTTYYLYIFIPKNEFVYSTGTTKTPEVVLSITDPLGNLVTNIDGFNYGTTKGNTGFDITEHTGLIEVAQSYPISSNSSSVATIQDWQVTLTIVNLDSNQNVNAEKTLEAEIILQSEDTLSIGPVCYGEEMASCFVEHYTFDGNFLKHDENLVNGAKDNNYRYSGSSSTVNNYVCFGSESYPCPANNLYRIIGVFNIDGENKVKLAKNSTYSGVSYNNSSSYLNTTYYNTLSEVYQNMISESTWYIGGSDNTNTNYTTSYGYYRDVIGAPLANKTTTTKINLMYIHDFGYAAYQNAWHLDLDNYSGIASNNWLASATSVDAREWTITTIFNNSVYGLLVNYWLEIVMTATSSSSRVRPTFYLNSNVIIKDGLGTLSDPYIIESPEIIVP